MAPPPPLPLTEYERNRLAHIKENKKRMTELGVKKMAEGMQSFNLNKGKGKEKNKEKEGGDDYNPDDESEEDTSVDTSEVYIMIKLPVLCTM